MHKIFTTVVLTAGTGNSQFLEGTAACNGDGQPILKGWPTLSKGNKFINCYQDNHKLMNNATNCYTANVYCDGGGTGSTSTYKYCISDNFLKECTEEDKKNNNLSKEETIGITAGATVAALAAATGIGIALKKKCEKNDVKDSNDPSSLSQPKVQGENTNAGSHVEKLDSSRERNGYAVSSSDVELSYRI